VWHPRKQSELFCDKTSCEKVGVCEIISVFWFVLENAISARKEPQPLGTQADIKS